MLAEVAVATSGIASTYLGINFGEYYKLRDRLIDKAKENRESALKHMVETENSLPYLLRIVGLLGREVAYRRFKAGEFDKITNFQK